MLFQVGALLGDRFLLPLFGVAISSILVIVAIKNEFGSIKLEKYSCSVVLLWFALVTIFCIGSVSFFDLLFNIVKVSVALLSFFAAYNLFVRLDDEYLGSIVHFILITVIVFLSIELLIRLQLAGGNVFQLLDRNFYLLKINSPFFIDSNAVGIYATLMLSLCFIFSRYLTRKKFLLYCIVISFFIVTSLSRSAYVATIFLILYYIYNLSHISLKYFMVCIFIFSLLILVPSAIDIIGSDGSGSTKLIIYSTILDKMENIPVLDILFGIGIEHGNYLYSYRDGMYSHAFIPMLLGEVGILGTVCYLIFILYLWISDKNSIMLTFLPVFILGLSYITPFYETIFFVLGINVAIRNFKEVPLSKVTI